MQEFVVLIADDEPDARTLAAVWLHDAGFVVLPTSNAKEALEMSRCKTRIDVLLIATQMRPDGFSGFELASQIRKEHPGLEVIIMTGLSEHEKVATERGFSFVRKPLTPADLMGRVRESVLRISPQREAGPSRQKAG